MRQLRGRTRGARRRDEAERERLEEAGELDASIVPLEAGGARGDDSDDDSDDSLEEQVSSQVVSSTGTGE